MRDPLIGEFGEGRALGLNLLDRLRGISGDEEGQQFSLKGLVLYLRSQPKNVLPLQSLVKQKVLSTPANHFHIKVN